MVPIGSSAPSRAVASMRASPVDASTSATAMRGLSRSRPSAMAATVTMVGNV